MPSQNDGSEALQDNSAKLADMLQALKQSHREMEKAIESAQNQARSVLEGTFLFSKDGEDLMQVAFHEAGHGVVARLLGVNVHSIEITNLRSPRNRLCGLMNPEGSFGDDAQGARHQMAMLLAGGIALRHFLAGADGRDSVDLAFARQIARKIHGLEAPAQAIEDELQRSFEAAEGIVKANRQKIAEVAGMLIAFTAILDTITHDLD